MRETVTPNTLQNFVHELAAYGFHRVFPKLAHRRNLRKRENMEIERDLLPLLVDASRESVDVGASVGQYTEQLAILTRHVYAFEPHPHLARLLRSFPPHRVTVEQRAVSNVSGRLVYLQVPIFDGRQGKGLASIEPRRGSGKVREYPVETTTIDTLADRDIGFVKIDVEGHELSVLVGAQQLIARQRPTFLVEAEDRHRPRATNGVFEFFAQQGYCGVFCYGDKLLSVEEFTPDMQDVSLLRDGAARRESTYPNNFIFLPAERWSPQLESQIQQRLISIIQAEAAH
jgi:FkbM family methyltransferase